MSNGTQRPTVMTVKPSSAIRSNYKEFSNLCHEIDEPVVITNNGENDLVVMSHEAFCRREAWINLQMRLLSADRQIDERNITEHKKVFSDLRERINAAD